MIFLASSSPYSPTSTLPSLQVQLLRWEGPRGGGQPEVHDMKIGERGAWSLQVPPAWEGSYYKYRCGRGWIFVWGGRGTRNSWEH